eukprot:7625638-Heterocapsa_arctica.AAC.1
MIHIQSLLKLLSRVAKASLVVKGVLGRGRRRSVLTGPSEQAGIAIRGPGKGGEKVYQVLNVPSGPGEVDRRRK